LSCSLRVCGDALTKFSNVPIDHPGLFVSARTLAPHLMQLEEPKYRDIYQ